MDDTPYLDLEPEFPTVIDNSMRSAFVTCRQKWYLQYLCHLQPAKVNPHLWAGGCFAKGMEGARKAYYEAGLPAMDAVCEGAKEFIKEWGLEYNPTQDETVKTFEAMLGAYYDYFQQYPLDSDDITPYQRGGRAAVEYSFALPIPGTRHPVTGEPVMWAGRFDMLGEYANKLWVVDEKTTTQLGATWLRQWDLRSQFLGYTWASREYGLDVEGAIIRGVSILKYDYGHAQVIVPRPQWMIDEWLRDLVVDVQDMIATWQSMHFRKNWDGGCSMYGGCSYRELCKIPNPSEWLKGYYHRRVWNPLRSDKENSGVMELLGELYG